MAISRFSASRLTQGLPKYQTAWDSDNVAQGALEPIAYTEGIKSSGAVLFSNIPQHYRDLVIVVSTRSTAAVNYADMAYTFNGGAAYTTPNTFIYADGAAGSSRRSGVATFLYSAYRMPAANAPALIYGSFITNIFNYSSTSMFKTTLTRTGGDYSTGGSTFLNCGVVHTTSAITSIGFAWDPGSSFDSGSTFALYGLRSSN